MAIIRVPAPSPESFRKHRPISDLVKSQIKHFQHLEHKLHLDLPTKFSPHELTTEAAAAQYIAEVTTALCGRGAADQQAATPLRIVAPAKTKSKRKPASTHKGIPLAASASKEKPRTKKHHAKKHSRKKS